MTSGLKYIYTVNVTITCTVKKGCAWERNTFFYRLTDVSVTPFVQNITQSQYRWTAFSTTLSQKFNFDINYSLRHISFCIWEQAWELTLAQTENWAHTTTHQTGRNIHPLSATYPGLGCSGNSLRFRDSWLPSPLPSQTEPGTKGSPGRLQHTPTDLLLAMQTKLSLRSIANSQLPHIPSMSCRTPLGTRLWTFSKSIKHEDRFGNLPCTLQCLCKGEKLIQCCKMGMKSTLLLNLRLDCRPYFSLHHPDIDLPREAPGTHPPF